MSLDANMRPVPASQPVNSSQTGSQAGNQRVRQACALGALGLLLSSLSGCAVVSGNAVSSQVRIIDASANTALVVDVYAGGSGLAYNLGLGTTTSYIQISPGIYTTNTDVTKTQQVLATTRGTLAANNQYTILVGDSSVGLQNTILTDQSTAAPSGAVSIRILDQSSRAGAVDLYLIPTGATILQVRPVLTNVVFGSNGGYLNVPSGAYTLVALPTGTVPTAMTTSSVINPSSVSYTGGSAFTVVLIDTPVVTVPGLQIIVVHDYDSPNAQS